VAVPPLPRPDTKRFLTAYTEGLTPTAVEHLFTRDTPEAYRFFARHLDEDAIKRLPWPRRVLAHTRGLFLAVTLKLSPARRALYAVALVSSLVGLIELARDVHMFIVPHPAFVPGTLWLFTGFALVNLLALLELADRLSLKNDLEVARQIQQSMLPRSMFRAEGLEAFGMTRPANTVGGDFFEILPLRDGRILLALGDVAGKGSPAALLMALFLAIMRTLVDAGFEGPALVERLNTQVLRHAPGTRFITLFLATFDPRTGVLTYVNAGQNPPLVRHASGRYDRLETSGMALGLSERATYASGSTALVPGDLLVMFSDGIVEAEDEDGRPFDEAGVQAIVDGAAGTPVKEIGWGTFAAVERHTGGRRLADDLTILVARPLPPLPGGPAAAAETTAPQESGGVVL
jgi:sigma-B regulation protein RsbU (phosphoserine phosphatase)